MGKLTEIDAFWGPGVPRFIHVEKETTEDGYWETTGNVVNTS